MAWNVVILGDPIIMPMPVSKSALLKLCLFATGLSGIVAEYILSTLATYFLGNSVVQWTMILSVMLFSMGLGSRLSRHIDRYLLEIFVGIEFVLSVLVSGCALATYTMAAYTDQEGLLIYGLSIVIGLLIGMEIPLVVRLNDAYEELRVNVSAVMEKDYYGSLLGGVFFAFVGLPYLGLTYTPFVLGMVNFGVAVALFGRFGGLIPVVTRTSLTVAACMITSLLAAGAWWAEPIVLHGEQQRYKDKVVFSAQSEYQQLTVTRWKDHHWFYINGNQQLSTLDEWLYHEPLVHPAMMLHPAPQEVLILGGGDGCAAREVLKYPGVRRVTVVDLDPMVTRLALENPIFSTLNDSAFFDARVELIHQDAYTWLEQTTRFYDVIISDFPDPKSIEIGRLFSREFFLMCRRQLRPGGVMSVQSGSPYYATMAFRCIGKTLRAAGFEVLPLHNQVLTMGEWGWHLAQAGTPPDTLKSRLWRQHPRVPVRWLTPEAIQQITSFGRDLIEVDTAALQVNSVHHPILVRYYREGNWDLF